MIFTAEEWFAIRDGRLKVIETLPDGTQIDYRDFPVNPPVRPPEPLNAEANDAAASLARAMILNSRRSVRTATAEAVRMVNALIDDPHARANVDTVRRRFYPDRGRRG